MGSTSIPSVANDLISGMTRYILPMIPVYVLVFAIWLHIAFLTFRYVVSRSFVK